MVTSTDRMFIFQTIYRRVAFALVVGLLLTVAGLTIRDGGRMLPGEQVAQRVVSYGFPFGYFQQLTLLQQRSENTVSRAGEGNSWQVTPFLTNLLFWFAVAFGLTTPRRWLLFSLTAILVAVALIAVTRMPLLWAWER